MFDAGAPFTLTGGRRIVLLVPVPLCSESRHTASRDPLCDGVVRGGHPYGIDRKPS
jgi:hypothetical protein